MSNQLREDWLNRAKDRIVELVFKPHDLRLPPILRFSCAVMPTSKSGFAVRPSHADDGSTNIFITAEYGPDDVMEILSTIVHELCHANCYAEGHEECAHGFPFNKVIRTVGLEGKPKYATAVEGTELWTTLEGIAAELGPYPHSPIRPKPKKTRQSRILTYVSPTDETYTVKCKYDLVVDKGPPRDYNNQPMVPKDPSKVAELEDLESNEAAAE